MIYTKLRSILFLVLVIFALVASPISAEGDNSQGNGPNVEDAPGHSDDGSGPGNGNGDEDHGHNGSPGVDWLPCI